VTALLKVERIDGREDRLVLSSAHNYNALSEQLLTELLEQVRLARDSNARFLVLDHRGKAFCTGVDLRERAEAGKAGPHSGLLASLLVELWTFPKPVIARVEGIVRGGGMALLACCDFVVAGRAASFGYTEVRVGVFPALVAAVTFPKLAASMIGPWMLTGEPFDAAEAHRLGLVTRVTAAGAPVTIEPEAAALLRGGPLAVVQTKCLLRQAGHTVPDAIAKMRRLSEDVFGTPEAVEGMAAFQQHRSPAWAPDARVATK
jgi:enoyl-CoA hydratase/carnithine racemase